MKKRVITLINGSLLILFQLYSIGQDRDLDGLLDSWETSGFGVINPRIHDINPQRADFFLLPVYRAETNRTEADAQILLVKRFFASLPNRNPDGTTGINVIILPGIVLPASASGRVYTELYEIGVPMEWRNFVHGYLLEPGMGGGGQTSSPRWSASGYNWRTVVHELGHQFGLTHEPPGSERGPLFTSLMNYDYSYSFNGDPNMVHFSMGRFSSVRLNESNLNETLNFPISQLRFLSKNPYYFRLDSISPTQTSIDWNRNGIPREMGVKADINAGFSMPLGNEVHLNHTAGSPALAAVNSYLYLIYPKLSSAPSSWVTAEAVASEPRGFDLFYQRINNNNAGAEMPLLRLMARTSPSAVGVDGKLAISFIGVNKKPTVYMWLTDNMGLKNNAQELGALIDISQNADQAILAVTGRPRWSSGASIKQEQEKLWMLAWDRTTKRVRITPIDYSISQTTGRPRLKTGTASPINLMEGASVLLSDGPIGAAFNRTTQQLALVTNTTWNGSTNHIKVSFFRWENNTWRFESSRMMGNQASGFKTNAAPIILIDDTRNGGATGKITIYVKGNVPVNNNSQLYRCSMIEDRNLNDGWLVSKIRDDWSTTRSSPAVAIYGEEVALAMRWHGGELDNKIVYFGAASGIGSRDLIDFNEINHIATVGLSRAIVR